MSHVKPAGGLVEIGLPEAARIAIAGLVHHPGVAIAEVLPLGHAEHAHRRLELAGPDLAEASVVVGRVHVGDDDLAELAAGAGDEHDAVAGPDGLGHGPAGPDRLVVGMGVDGHQRQGSGVRHGLDRSRGPAEPAGRAISGARGSTTGISRVGLLAVRRVVGIRVASSRGQSRANSSAAARRARTGIACGPISPPRPASAWRLRHQPGRRRHRRSTRRPRSPAHPRCRTARSAGPSRSCARSTSGRASRARRRPARAPTRPPVTRKSALWMAHPMRRIGRGGVMGEPYPRGSARYHRRMSSQPAGPLAGLRVVDCSTVLAGPYCTMLLADLGADVVKVEPPEGDATRGWGPPWVGSEADGTRTAAYYLAVNRNKRSIRLDLKQPDGAAVLRRLLVGADVLVENFRAGGFARLGFGDDELAAINPRPRPPRDHRLRLDGTRLRAAGLRLRHPGRVRPDVDHRGAGRGRRRPDEGRRRDRRRRRRAPGRGRGPRGAGRRAGPWSRQAVSGSTSRSSPRPSRSSSTRPRTRSSAAWRRAGSGNAHPNIVPYETFPTADGEIAIAAGSERQWPRLCRALGLPALADDPRFATNGDRVANRGELVATLRERLAERTSAEWLAALDAADVPAGPINDIAEAFGSAWARERGMTIELDHPVLGRIRQVAPPFELSVDARERPNPATAPRRADRRDPPRAWLRRRRNRAACATPGPSRHEDRRPRPLRDRGRDSGGDRLPRRL